MPARRAAMVCRPAVRVRERRRAVEPEATAAAPGKLLLVVAHPDDEYAFAGATYRLCGELGWHADQVVITNGEGGYRYAALAERIYGLPLTAEAEGRKLLPAIRRQETERAGRILGVRRHYFLDQRDAGFDGDKRAASTSDWDYPRVEGFLAALIELERYDAVFVLLPTAGTHAHHREAALLTLRAASRMPEARRPLLFGVDSAAADDDSEFDGLDGLPLTQTCDAKPAFEFDRERSFGHGGALNYQIVVNWVIAEHKSQGLFQCDAGRHARERYWLFSAAGADAAKRAQHFVHGLAGA